MYPVHFAVIRWAIVTVRFIIPFVILPLLFLIAPLIEKNAGFTNINYVCV